jgi:hypothetical protein
MISPRPYLTGLHKQRERKRKKIGPKTRTKLGHREELNNLCCVREWKGAVYRGSFNTDAIKKVIVCKPRTVEKERECRSL